MILETQKIFFNIPKATDSFSSVIEEQSKYTDS